MQYDDKNILFLKCISDLQQRVGKSIYQISVAEIMNYYAEIGQDISQRSVYLYLKNLGSELLIQKISRRMKVYSIEKNYFKQGEYPNAYFINADGSESAIKDIPEHIALEKGDKVLIYYELTEKGKQILKENEIQ